MKASGKFRGSLIETYPATELMARVDAEGPIWVDIGSGVGHDSTAFLVKHPEAKGRIAVQDRKEVLEEASLPDGIQKMPHDFYQAQPVHGAAVYYL